MPEALRAAAWRALRVIGMPRVSDVVRSGGGCDTYDFWNRIGRRNELVKNLTEQWTEMGLDAVVCPAIGLPAWPHGASGLGAALEHCPIARPLWLRGWVAGGAIALVLHSSEMPMAATNRLRKNIMRPMGACIATAPAQGRPRCACHTW